MSFAGETLVHTLTGDVPIAMLLARNEPIYGFTWDGQRITVGRVTVAAAGVKPCVRVRLDSGRELVVSKDQNALAMGTWDRLSICQKGLSVLPLYLGQTSLGYRTYKQQGSVFKQVLAPCDRRRVRLVARMVYEWVAQRPIEIGMLVRYIDKDPKNCHPSNLRLEGRPNRKRGRLRGTMKLHIEAQKMIAKMEAEKAAREAQRVAKAAKEAERAEKAEKAGKVGKKAKGGPNHKVVAWEPCDADETFDLIGIECDNFAVGEVFFATVTDGPA